MAMCREPGESEYEWVREYTYKVQNAEDRTTFWFLFGEDCVTYCDLNTRLDLRKRSRARKEGESEFQRPSKVGMVYLCKETDSRTHAVLTMPFLS